ncbi:Cloroperoxidase [Aulographum hederae CBS 113979]|uniref:Cloroperoxidase n=1 Tax=Aulographum hederae CBS 113979 TaxID=1176131 RepID=A0A6G1HAS6_9PEZI|nr:Cloroperoxidase [Aulographum hederae CBS 113979]
MKSLSQACVATVLALIPSSLAFPQLLKEIRRDAGIDAPIFNQPAPSLNKRVSFDPKTQLVSTSGTHKFVAPGPNDQRGPCPGLNAMANHGYLPHNGVATIDQFITGTYDVFGMGVDLSTLLAIYGSVFDGNLVSWSIGGPTSLLNLGGLGGLLGTPQGISGSHNKYEGDASPTRGDLYQYGNSFKLQMSQFQTLYDLGKAEDNYDLDLLTNYRVTRFQESIDNNPYFFNAPFSGVVAQPAAWSFIYRFMANKSSEYPEGRLTGSVLKSFYAITGDDGSFVYTPGHERIPENWYKRAIGDEYTIPFLALDGVKMLLEHPQFASVGGNTGGVDSFTGLDPTDLTGGVFNAASLAEGNNLMCFGLELTIQETPDLLAGIFEDDTLALGKLLPALRNATGSLGCPSLTQVNEGQFDEFPGYAKLKANGQYRRKR